MCARSPGARRGTGFLLTEPAETVGIDQSRARRSGAVSAPAVPSGSEIEQGRAAAHGCLHRGLGVYRTPVSDAVVARNNTRRPVRLREVVQRPHDRELQFNAG